MSALCTIHCIFADPCHLDYHELHVKYAVFVSACRTTSLVFHTALIMYLVAVSFELTEAGEYYRPLVTELDEKDGLHMLQRSAQGVFVVDAFAQFRGPLPWYSYLANILGEVYRMYGYDCLALVSSSASFEQDSYMRILHRLRSNSDIRPQWVFWISMGNDLYPPG